MRLFTANMKGDDEDSQVSQETEHNPVKRSSRNLSEKKRRDRFNILVQELAGIVSPADGRKLDKTAVLELAISFLRKHQSNVQSLPRDVSGNVANWQPSFATDAEFNLIVTEALDSCIFAIENGGNILYASDSVLPLMGHLSDELHGTSLFSYVHQDDALRFWTKLALVHNGHNDHDSHETEALGNTNHFLIRIKCGRFYTRSTYKMVHCKFRCIRRPNEEEARTCVVIIGKIEQPQPNRIVTTADSSEKEFSYRLTMDWKYVYIDHRASSIIGFLPFEVLGTSVYEYCGPEDVFNIAQYHKFLIRLGKVTTCYYQHRTKGQSWVWLRSSCYISYNQWNSKPESIACTATVVNFDEVCLKQTETIQRDREHFTKIISRHGSDSVSSLNPWPSSWLFVDEEVDQRDRGTKFDQKEANETVLTSQFLTRFLQVPSDGLTGTLDKQSAGDVEMESDEERNEDLLWLENIKIPPGLSSVQIAMHMKLQEEYKKIAQQIQNQERQLKTIRKLIEWSRLLLELDVSFGAFEVEESLVDSEDVMSVTSCS